MSHISDLIKEHIVIVDNGSGVLVQPMTEEYSYILTAKHNILVDRKDSESGTKEIVKIELKNYKGDELHAKGIYKHQTLDVAIICIDFYPDINTHPCQKILGMDDNIWLYGYPAHLRKKYSSVNQWIESYNLVPHDLSHEKIIFKNKETTIKIDIDGFSGGGLFYVDEAKNQFFLMGIDSACTSHGEYVDRIEGIPIGVFNELLSDNELATLKPLHLSDFKYLIDQTFPKKYYEHLADFKWICFTHVVDILKKILMNQVGGIETSPLYILKNNLQYLEVNHQDESDLENIELWSALLELILLNSLIDNENYDEFKMKTDIEALFKEFRIIYINSTKNWEAHYESIITTNTDGLNDNGKIILVTGCSPMSEAVISADDVQEVIDNISHVSEDGYIDNALRISQKKYPIIHWISLHNQCIFSKMDQFKEYKSISARNENIKLLKQQYQSYLNT